MRITLKNDTNNDHMYDVQTPFMTKNKNRKVSDNYNKKPGMRKRKHQIDRNSTKRWNMYNNNELCTQRNSTCMRCMKRDINCVCHHGSFARRVVRRMRVEDVDPSLALGFYCHTKGEMYSILHDIAVYDEFFISSKYCYPHFVLVSHVCQ